MNRRLELFKRLPPCNDLKTYNSKVSTDERLPWWLVTIDEYGDLSSSKKEKEEIENLLINVASQSRATGIHLIIATQKPSAQVISTTIRSNLGAKLALNVSNVSDSLIILDEKGAEDLVGKGDAIFQTSKGKKRFQVATSHE